MDVADFAYELPEGSIAQTPIEPRDRARLLVDRGPGEAPEHRTVADLPAFVRPGDVVVVNSTRVLPARLRLRKPTGGAVEVLLLERLPTGEWEALVRPSRKVAPGTELAAGADLSVRFGGPGPGEGTRLVELRTAGAVDELAVLDRHGVVPLPPYITGPLADPERYQTVFADRPGSVAAPTAGLHLTPAVLDGCRAAGRASRWWTWWWAGHVPPDLRPEGRGPPHARRALPGARRDPGGVRGGRAAGGRVVAVGTTTVRALESAALSGQLEGRTELFIHRPWRWRVVDVLLTNFHLPRSSLLVLVDAFVGPRWRDLYGDALAAGYRFLSFGDAMLLDRSL